MTSKLLNEANTLDEAIGIAIGVASTCWENLNNAGTFNDVKACDVITDLSGWIRSNDNSALKKVQNLHFIAPYPLKPGPIVEMCQECNKRWPCPTILAVVSD